MSGKKEGNWCEFFLYKAKISAPEVGTQVVISRKKHDNSANLPNDMYILQYLTPDYMDSFVWDCGVISFNKNSPRAISVASALTSGVEYNKSIGWSVPYIGSDADTGTIADAVFPFFSYNSSKTTYGAGYSTNYRWVEDCSGWSSVWVDTAYWGSNSQLTLADESPAQGLWNPNGGEYLYTGADILITESSNNHNTEFTALAVNHSKFGQSASLKFPVFRHEVDCGNHIPRNWAYYNADLKPFQRWKNHKSVYPKTEQTFNCSYWQYSDSKSIIIKSPVVPAYTTGWNSTNYSIPTKGWPFVADFSSSDKFYNNLVITSDQIETGVTYPTANAQKVDDCWYFRYFAGTPLIYAKNDGPCTINLQADQGLDLWISTQFSDVLPQNDTHNIPKSEISVDNSVATTLSNAVHLKAGLNEVKFNVEKGKTYFIKWAKTGTNGKGGGTVTIPRTYEIIVD